LFLAAASATLALIVVLVVTQPPEIPRGTMLGGMTTPGEVDRKAAMLEAAVAASEGTLFRLMVPHPTIDGVDHLSATLTACKATPGPCKLE
jgi:hypothetical protein